MMALLTQCAAVLVFALTVCACGEVPAPEIEIPSWAKVAPEQIAEAETCVHDGEELRGVL